MKTLTVSQLIQILEEVKDKSKPVYGFIIDEDVTYDICPIQSVTISDRVDLNIILS